MNEFVYSLVTIAKQCNNPELQFLLDAISTELNKRDSCSKREFKKEDTKEDTIPAFIRQVEEEKKRLLGMRQIKVQMKETIRQVIREFINSGVVVNFRSRNQINNGYCAEFATTVWERLGKPNSVKIINNTDLAPNEPYIHTFLAFNGRYFDSECPLGRQNWRELPLFKRIIKTKTLALPVTELDFSQKTLSDLEKLKANTVEDLVEIDTEKIETITLHEIRCKLWRTFRLKLRGEYHCDYYDYEEEEEEFIP